MKRLLLISMILASTCGFALEVKDFTFSHIGKAEGLSSQRIFSICQTKSGAIWWASMTGPTCWTKALHTDILGDASFI